MRVARIDGVAKVGSVVGAYVRGVETGQIRRAHDSSIGPAAIICEGNGDALALAAVVRKGVLVEVPAGYRNTARKRFVHPAYARDTVL